jgi:chromosome segregation protein
MLKRLELVGFKSFADKTRFDFAPGITCIVGPNGSGKSNVVDAVRWILGEQSAKSLRGGEMADVIFNGSSSRKSFGLAEVSVIFDNTRRLLAVEADEVELTRRVYRDGTGEYLINGQMSRLKDIKEIFLGSGAGAGGYTIIAQGRVDELLQASTKDRREIFDEAAGISRFKAKKIEALRKLIAVEQNLTRSRDRLDGLEGQLRTLRMQASKAQKHREYSDRLQELRVAVGTREYQEITAALAVEQAALAELQAQVSGVTTRTDEHDRTLRDLDRRIARSEESLRQREGQIAAAKQQIAAFETTLKHERAAAAGHETELLRLAGVRVELGYRVKVLEADCAKATSDAAAAEERLAAEQVQADAAAAALTGAATRVARMDRDINAGREQQFELVRQSTAARSTATASLEQVQRLQKDYTRKLGEIEQKSARRGTLETALDGLSQADADLQARLGSARDRLAGLQSQRDRLADSQERVQRTLEDLRVRQGDLRGRAEVLEGLERTLEGIGSGVREVLGRLHREPALAGVIGLVADLLTVPHDIAPFIELALGETAQRFIVRDEAAVDAVAAALGDLAGRVGFVPAEEPNPPAPFPLREGGEEDQPPSFSPPLLGEGFLTGEGLLAAQVQCEHPEVRSLPEQLLGNVILVVSLADARRLAPSFPQHRFVTRSGELLEPDGTLVIGPLTAEVGIVSRKSELRDLRGRVAGITEQIAAAEVELAEFRRQAASIGGTIGAVEEEIELLSSEAGDLQQRITLQRQQLEQLDELIELLRAESQVLEDEVQRSESHWIASKLEAEQTEQAAEQLQIRLEDLQTALRAAEQDRGVKQQGHTEAQVALSRAVADRDRARERQTQTEAELRKRKIDAINEAATFHSMRTRLIECDLAMLRASTGMAEAYREKDARERQAVGLATDAAADREARERLREELDVLRSGWQETQAAAHARELAVHDLQGRRDAVANRIREDYGVDIAALEHGTGDREQEAQDNPAEPHAEIDDLKKKIARLGSVNMEALEELTRVEAEHGALKAQHDDLDAARASLQSVIDTINTDSRKLFTDTLTAVRTYFQELFRKLFGGGQADIHLEEGVDVLESGIEIIARPPGKELRALSLLSGGEKTLTAIALLLAIFRNKPSPFCLLDEVDAALDEANTARLAGVLRDFLDHSQFIVITHKKRTMAAADRLWGVTMQESGVSRLLPMRFEDWSDEDGESQQAA